MTASRQVEQWLNTASAPRFQVATSRSGHPPWVCEMRRQPLSIAIVLIAANHCAAWLSPMSPIVNSPERFAKYATISESRRHELVAVGVVQRARVIDCVVDIGPHVVGKHRVIEGGKDCIERFCIAVVNERRHCRCWRCGCVARVS